MPIYNPGDTLTTVARFVNPDGSFPLFAVAPSWTLYNADNMRVDAGNTVNTPSTPNYVATVTLPTLNSLYANSSEMRVEIMGVDAVGKQWQSNSVISISYQTDFEPNAVLYIHGATNQFSVEFPTTPTSASYTITDMEENVVLASTNIPVDNLTQTQRGYSTIVNIPNTTFLLGSKYPYLITISMVYSGKTDIQQRPLFFLSNRLSQILLSLKSYLDKAQLVEIDPTLQWNTPELVQYLYDGMNHINSSKPEVTYWNLQDASPGLTQIILYAGAFVALNARYLAEGMNDFEFQGASTQLTVDRKTPLSYKIDEIKAYLDENLPPIKTALIRTVGPGTPPNIPGATVVSDLSRVVRLGISIGPATNRKLHPAALRSRVYWPF